MEEDPTQNIEPVNNAIKISKNFDGSWEIYCSSSVCSMDTLKGMTKQLKKDFIDTEKTIKPTPSHIN